MFTTYRFSFKLDREGHRLLFMAVKTWPTFEKAMKYILQYCSVPWFAGAAIEDASGFVLYERTPMQTEYHYDTPKFTPIRITPFAEDDHVLDIPIFYPAFENVAYA